MSQYPIIVETLCGVFVGVLGGLTARQSSGRVCLTLFLFALVIVRIAMCGSVNMANVLNHLLDDISQVLSWTLAHQPLTMGITIGLVIAPLLNLSRRAAPPQT
jgi:uncharacterized membrane protein